MTIRSWVPGVIGGSPAPKRLLYGGRDDENEKKNTTINWGEGEDKDGGPFVEDLKVAAGPFAKWVVAPAYEKDGTCTFVLPTAPGVSDDAPAPASQARSRAVSMVAAMSGP